MNVTPAAAPKKRTASSRPKASKRDHVQIARDFEDLVLSGAFPCGKLFRAAVERQRRDLEREKSDPEFPYRFDPDVGAKVLRFIETALVHVEGPESIVGKAIVPEPWQVWFIVTAWGWVNKVTGHPRFRRIVLFLPKGQGKTLLCSTFALYTLATDRSGGRIVSAATTRDQAKLAFRASRLMLVRAPKIADRFGLKVEEHRLVKPATGADYRPISAEAGGAEGQLPRLQIVDEIHCHPNRDLFDNLRSMGAKRPDSQMVVISTAGFDMSPNAIGYEVYSYARDLLLGLVHDDSQFALLVEADRDADPWDPKTWRQANPNLGVSIDPVEVANEANEARQKPTAQASFFTKRLGWWVQSAQAWMDMEAWDRCANPNLRREDFDGQSAYIGVDLATTRDLTAKALVFVRDGGDGQRRYAVFAHAWLPAESPTLRDGADGLKTWAAQGHLSLVPGGAMDFSLGGSFGSSVMADLQRNPGSEVCYDPFAAHQLATDLEAQGTTVVQIRQGWVTQSGPMKELEAAVLSGRLEHDGDPLLRWCMSNVIARTDRNGNISPDRENESRKIDAAVAIINALVRAQLAEVSGSAPAFYRLD